ncbi:hypothetical protein [Mobilicoccus pelagius]|uniref:Uncharacterized protein n=1 Tax=Mobilicoccus pelagius NBRC 104925 TaxID=1089455 RepID=H5US75_9MICO|nr:hypothetical protein [Mobilicoccus pelagius]GAB48583.1 hypothetical protein MOPEL_074_00700 [Mobilicoccus pelagius NBRC 104925]
MNVMGEILAGLLPSIGIGYLFYKIMRLLLEGDRQERAAYAQWQAEHDAERAGRAATTTGTHIRSGADSAPTAGISTRAPQSGVDNGGAIPRD